MLYRFLTYVNSTEEGTTYSNIAYYISNNFTKVTQMNLEELADACYVSQATISRFCRFLGFESFTHFKIECQRSLRDGENRVNTITRGFCQDDESYKENFSSYLANGARELIDVGSQMNIWQLDTFLARIHDTEDVVFFGIHRCASVISELQFSLALKDKFVKAYSGSALQLECARNLTKDSLAVVFSANDGFWFEAHDVLDALVHSPCYKILVTSVHDCEREDIFDEIIMPVGERERGGSYMMMGYSEMMISRYFLNY